MAALGASLEWAQTDAQVMLQVRACSFSFKKNWGWVGMGTKFVFCRGADDVVLCHWQNIMSALNSRGTITESIFYNNKFGTLDSAIRPSADFIDIFTKIISSFFETFGI